MRPAWLKLGLACLVTAMVPGTVRAADMALQKKQEAAAAYAGAEIWRHTVFTGDMDKSIAFWEQLGYTLRPPLHESLGGPEIEKSFGLKPGEKIKLRHMDPGDSNGVLIGLISLVGEPLRTFTHEPNRMPQAGETFLLMYARNEPQLFAKLKATGITVEVEPQSRPNGGLEGEVITPEGNRMVIYQPPKEEIIVVPPIVDPAYGRKLEQLDPAYLQKAAAAYADTQVSRLTLFTDNIDRSIAFWQALGFTVRAGLNDPLSVPKIEKGFGLKPGESVRQVIMDPGDTGGVSIGLISAVGDPFPKMPRSTGDTPQAGETFELISVRDARATYVKLLSIGIRGNGEPRQAIPGGSFEGSIFTPEGNRMVIVSPPK